MPRGKKAPIIIEEETQTFVDEPKFEEKPKKNEKKYIFKTIIFLIIIGLAIVSVYYYRQYEKIKKNPEIISQEETQSLVSQVGKLMELPNETPSVATVSDKDKLKDQNFFQKAQNGDKVLIFTNAKQAIIYRPSAKKIIEVAPLITDQNNNRATENSNSQPQNSEKNIEQ